MTLCQQLAADRGEARSRRVVRSTSDPDLDERSVPSGSYDPTSRAVDRGGGQAGQNLVRELDSSGAAR